MQVVWRSGWVKVPLTLEDLCEQEDDEQQQRIHTYLQRDRESGLRLDVAPLCRAHVVRRHASAHTLILTMHHAIFDGWSLGLLLDSLCAHYTRLIAEHLAGAIAENAPVAFARSPPALAPALADIQPLDATSPSFKHFLQFERTQPLGDAREYWTKRLLGLDSPPPLRSLLRKHREHAEATDAAFSSAAI